jgi:hypothetical protein
VRELVQGYDPSMAATLLLTDTEAGALFSFSSCGGLSVELCLLIVFIVLEVVRNEGLGVAISPEVFLDTAVGVESKEDFLGASELRELVRVSGVELVGFLIPVAPATDAKLEVEPIDRRRAAIAELGGLVVLSVKRALF